MAPNRPTIVDPAKLERHIARFETDCARWRPGDRWPVATDYLPPLNDPDYAAIRQELELVDRELRERADGSRTQTPGLDDQRSVPTTEDLSTFARPSRDGAGEDLPELVGRFRLEAIVGRGGFGVVYRATDTRLGRTVAVKLPRAGLTLTGDEAERFLREARHAASLCHPGIVAIHEAGLTDAGLCYIVSDLIDGRSLATERAAAPAGRLEPRRAARILLQIAEALAHAHGRGLVHRDVKPSNILIDRQGHPWLTDFGLARLETGEVSLTVDGQVLGTPAYMSPEQARGEARRLDARSDIYSLGVILYELLTGEVPFRGSPAIVIARVVEDEPTPPRSLIESIPRDLETICLKAMAKEPGRRYATASDLADDLRRFLEGKPIQARPVGSIERLGKWARRRPWIAAMAAALAAVTILGFAGVTWQWLRAASARDGMEHNLYAQLIARAEAELAAGQVARAFELLDACPERRRGWEWRYLRSADAHRLRVLPGGDPQLWDVVYSPDGARVAVGRSDGRIRIVSAHPDTTNEAKVTDLLTHDGPVHDLVFTPDGRSLVSVGTDCQVVRWDLDRNALAWTVRGDADNLWAVAVSPDGRLVATGGNEGVVRLWSTADGSPRGELRGHRDRIRSLAFTPDGRTLASGSWDTTIGVWTLADRRQVASLRDDVPTPVTGVAFLPDGRLVSVGWFSVGLIWDVPRRRVLRRLDGFSRGYHGLAVSPDGQRLAVSTDAGPTRIWSTETGQELWTLRGHEVQSWGVAFSPDGTQIATTAWDGTIRLWTASTTDSNRQPTDGLFLVLELPGFVSALKRSRDGRWLATGAWDGLVRLLDLQSSRPSPCRLTGHQSGILAVDFAPDGRTLASASWDKTARLWDVLTGAPGPVLVGHDKNVWDVAFHPDGSSLATAGWDAVRLWSREGEPLGFLPETEAYAVAFAPEGTELATATSTGEAHVWDLASKTIRLTLRGHQGGAVAVAYSPAEGLLATGARDARCRLWSLSDGQLLQTLDAGEGPITTLAFSADGRFLASMGVGGSVWVWEVATGRELAHRTQPENHARGLAFDSDDRLYFGAYDRTVRLWNWGEPSARDVP